MSHDSGRPRGGRSGTPSAERSLAAAEELRAIMESAHDNILLVSLDGTIRYINRTVPDLEVSDVIGTEIYRWVRSDQRDRIRSSFARVEATQGPDTYEVEYDASDGEIRHFQARVSPVLRNGEVRAFVVSSRDVTESKAAEDALRVSERRYRGLIEELTEFVVRWRPGDGTRTFVNEAYCRYFGLTRDEAVGTSFYPLIHPEFQDLVRQRLARLTRAQPQSMGEHQIQRPDGSLGWNEWSDRAIYDDQGELVEIESVGRDITERKKAEQELRASERRYRFLAENMSDVIMTLDLELRITYVNPAVESLLDRRPDELLGRNLQEIVLPESMALVVQTLGEELALEGEPGLDPQRSRVLDLELIHADGSRRFVEAKASFWRAEEEVPAGVVAVARDLTSWKEGQEALRQSEDRLRQAQRLEAIGQLAGGVAHDFNNLLTVIIGNLQLLRQRSTSDSAQNEHLDRVAAAAEKAAGLTRQLLAFGRRQQLNPKVLDLNRATRSIEPLLRTILEEAIDLELDLAEDLGRVSADPAQIEQVLVNLTLNARDALSTGGKISISTANSELESRHGRGHVVTPGAYVRLTFSDTGTGIAPEHRSRVFEPFFTTKEIGHGTGLGLSMVYGIVKQSGGYIWVDSDPESGTTFEIHLPRVEGQPDSESPARRGPGDHAERGSETILVVEDEPSVRQLAVFVLRREGYTVLEASDGQEALARMAAYGHVVDLVLTDAVMPRMSGAELATQLAGISPGTPLLFMSGHADRVLEAHGDPAGRRDLITKPFTPAVLAARVREILDRGRSQP